MNSNYSTSQQFYKVRSIFIKIKIIRFIFIYLITIKIKFIIRLNAEKRDNFVVEIIFFEF